MRIGVVRRLSALPLLAIVVVVLSGTGCGDSAESDQPVTYALSQEPAKVFVKRYAKLLATATRTKDCSELAAVNGRSPTRVPCPPTKALGSSMAKFKLIGAGEYGPGAVVDYKSGKLKNGAIVLFVASDRNWGVARFGVVVPPSVGTSANGIKDGTDKAVEDYLTAIREGDCDSYYDLSLTTEAKQAYCKDQRAATKAMATRLKANPDVEPEFEGGTSRFAFYSFETPKPKLENTTISVIKADKGSASPYIILDALPSPTSAEQRRVQRELEKSKRKLEKKKAQPGTSPTTTDN